MRSVQQSGGSEGDVNSLPSFITGGQPPQNAGPNGHDGDRFNRRRRRHHRDMQGGAQGDESPDESPQPEPTPQPSE